MARTKRKSEPRTAIACYEPATGRSLGEVPVASVDDVQAAVAEAREAQRGWAGTSFATRRKVLRSLLTHLLEHADELCEVISRDSGKTLHHALIGEIWPVAEKLRWHLRHGERHLRDERVSSGLLVHKRARIQYGPLGVIGVIAPWNYPLQNIFGPAIPALFAGNAVIVKVSEWVAWSAERFQRIFDEALEAVGQPRGLVRIINGYGETGAALVRSGVDKVVFTGSMPNGRKVIASSAEPITPVILELGGKDSMIVCADAPLERAVHAALAGVYINAGQNCLAAERILVHDAVYDRFEKRVLEVASALTQGPPAYPGAGAQRPDVGAMVSPLQVDLVEALVEGAVKAGAKVLLGGERRPGAGQFFQPTILADVTPDMAIMNEEVFGPVMLLCRVADEEEALSITNGTDFGLSCTILSGDPERARRLADRVQTGSVSINDFGLPYMANDLPFGGVKGSGFGRLNGRDGLRAFTNAKALMEDRWPWLPMPPAKVFPVEPGEHEVTRAAVRLIYAPSLSGKAAAAKELVTTLLSRSRGA